MNADAVKAVRAIVEEIEKAYEFTLAYAAQGRRGDEQGSEIREYLDGLYGNLARLGDACRELAGPGGEEDMPFLALLEEDRSRAASAVQFVLGAPLIGSQLVDNFNASLHLRTLLTDLFLLDERLASL